MLNAILRKRAQVLMLISVLSILLTATAAFGATRLIKADRGGIIHMGPGVWFVIQPGALENDTVISADMKQTRDYIHFCFGPDGTEFSEPAKLKIAWRAINDMGVEGLTLYNDGDEEIGTEPNVRIWGVVYYVNHFSLYYYRRR